LTPPVQAMLIFCTELFMAYNSKRNIFPLWGISAFNIPAHLNIP